MHTGESKTQGGRVGEASRQRPLRLPQHWAWNSAGSKPARPPRLTAKSIDFAALTFNPATTHPSPFSYLNEYAARRLRSHPCILRCNSPCLGQTNPAIHDLIRANLHRAPMYSGQIQSTGPRYCPSIEDKVVRFADKTQPPHLPRTRRPRYRRNLLQRHQHAACRPMCRNRSSDCIPGLEQAEILRYGYAVEYDMVWPTPDRTRRWKPNASPACFSPARSTAPAATKKPPPRASIAGINAAAASHGQRRLRPPPRSSLHRRADRRSGHQAADRALSHVHQPRRASPAPAQRQRRRPPHPLGRDIGLVDDQRWARFTPAFNP